MTTIFRSIGWLVFFLLATAIALYAWFYFRMIGAPALGSDATGILTHIRDRPLWFFMHVGGGGLALFLAPWQFLGPLRRRAPALHRLMGRLYVIAILIGGSGGLMLAVNSYTADNIARFGFGSLAVLWLTTVAMAFAYAVQRNIASHRNWMIRSAALTFAAVTLRFYLPLASIYGQQIGVSFDDAYLAISWLCWVPNLIIAELIIRFWPYKGA